MPSPAVLTTYRQGETALVSLVWFRWSVKLGPFASNPECILAVFESVVPVRAAARRPTQ